MTEQKANAFSGLTQEQVKKLEEQYGKNELSPQKKESFLHKVFTILCEPMFLLLLIASVIYFLLGEPRDGIIMLVFVVGVISIDVIQEWKTDQTLNTLKDLSAPHITVIRESREYQIASRDLVPGDLMLLKEGIKIPADGEILRANDLCVDESTLTGEAEGAWKMTVNEASIQELPGYWRRDYCYSGTLVTQGSALVKVDKTGVSTEYGKIGMGILTALEAPSPLQRQIGTLVKTCAAIAGILFLLVITLTYINISDHRLIDRMIESILSGITLAMAMIPEEFPVILTVFLSMGAWRLARKKSLVRRLPEVETLGAVSVLCVDKTGTITMNQMTVQELWAMDGDEEGLSEVMGLGCETDAYDPMEKAMLAHCQKLGISEQHLFSGELITEYPFTNELKMMGHVWYHDGEILIAAKGSPESLITLCNLTSEEKQMVEDNLLSMSRKGLRVIGVGIMRPEKEEAIPSSLADCLLTFRGLIGLADPPRESVREDIRRCVKAGVRVVMITGDNGVTASSIAKQIGMPGSDQILTGEELDLLSEEDLQKQIRDVSIFSRVRPEHKMRIVKAFQAIGEIVAMTGDGVNDAPALKAADVGIAMGKRGSEVSREAADLVLLDDNFSTIVETIHDGRRIYENIRKAVGYVFTIHIPIAFSALLAPFMNIKPAELLLLPIHVVLLELIIDPTCSIVLERQPAEQDIMDRKPRNPMEQILTRGTLLKSILQGVTVFAASFLTYINELQGNPSDAATARTMGISVIIIANLFLVTVNSSNRNSILNSLQLLLGDHVFRMVVVGTLAGLLAIIYTPLSGVFSLTALSVVKLCAVFVLAALSVLWYEAVKAIIRRKKSRIKVSSG